MKRENEEIQQPGEHPGEQRVAQNPNPRANENLSGPQEERGKESADISDEVGSEITDGEDA